MLVSLALVFVNCSTCRNVVVKDARVPLEVSAVDFKQDSSRFLAIPGRTGPHSGIASGRDSGEWTPTFVLPLDASESETRRADVRAVKDLPVRRRAASPRSRQGWHGAKF